MPNPLSTVADEIEIVAIMIRLHSNIQACWGSDDSVGSVRSKDDCLLEGERAQQSDEKESLHLENIIVVNF